MKIIRKFTNKLPRISINRIAFVILSVITISCYLSPFLKSYNPQNLILGPISPSKIHWFGTDILGRDLLLRILHGGSISLTIGFCSTLITLCIGTIYGTISGLAKPFASKKCVYFLDVLTPLPFPLIIILLSSWNSHTIMLICSLGLLKWVTIARIIRTKTLFVKSQTFVDCAKSYGQNFFGILTKHIMPNLLTTLMACLTITIPSMMLDEAFVSFLGLGIQPPKTSWGLLILEGARNMEIYPWLLIFPIFIFSITILSFHFLSKKLLNVLIAKNYF